MPTETERKFLVQSDGWRSEAGPPRSLRQFYLGIREAFSMRVRIADGTQAWLTIKSGKGIVRHEYEYAIPLVDALELEAQAVGSVIEKRRFEVPHGRHTVEVDVFAGVLAPLVLAEIEAEDAAAVVELPAWLGPEVTHDGAYTNAALALNGLPARHSRAEADAS
ncbi:CYTH domain-containing protein [Mangrovibrevibacter kandeliae]|uniref:CYTH domain-containing protein n=1 Tax=Mangrovibrevibacter kandeliae TaxID=2968473 RepID=UPI002119B50B|nr:MULTISPECIES: CYTH domain-containing protein [unclassified Aurantimonas]MCQ8783107.1 CYTH domain-containing protein [Aurantimonas sp. CSK15Z-1]MCW4115703.1 CYTH domain-containing protein [Aurantimonas sp. MSK8Z-1]